MVKLAVQILVEAENIQTLSVDKDNHIWWLKLQCTSCREKNDKEHNLSLAETLPKKTGHGIAHYIAKCKFCSTDQMIEILPNSIRNYTCDDSFSTIVAFDCRGVEPYAFSFREDWIIKAKESNTEFTGVDLSSGEWADWDEQGKQEVAFYALEHRFVKA